MIVLAPAACILSGISLSEAFEVFTRSIKFSVSGLSPNAGDGVSASNVSMESQVMEADKKEDLLWRRHLLCVSSNPKMTYSGTFEVSSDTFRVPLNGILFVVFFDNHFHHLQIDYWRVLLACIQ